MPASLLDIPRVSMLPLDRGALLTLERRSYLELEAYVPGRASWTTIVTEDGEVWMIGGIWEIEPGSTVYINGGGLKPTPIGTSVPPGIVKRIRWGANLPPGAGESYRYTLFKNGIATASTFTVTGSTRKGGSDVEVTCVDGDELCVEVVVSDGAQRADHSGTIQQAPAV